MIWYWFSIDVVLMQCKYNIELCILPSFSQLPLSPDPFFITCLPEVILI